MELSLICSLRIVKTGKSYGSEVHYAAAAKTESTEDILIILLIMCELALLYKMQFYYIRILRNLF